MLCNQCSFIAHAKCAPNAPQICHPRAQLPYRETGPPRLERLGPTSPTTPSVPFPKTLSALTAFKRPPLSPNVAAQPPSSVSPIQTHETRTSLISQNPLNRQGKEAMKLLSGVNTIPGPSEPRSQDVQDGSIEALVFGDDVAEAARLSTITTHSVGSDQGREGISPDGGPGGSIPSPTTPKKRTRKNSESCLVQ